MPLTVVAFPAFATKLDHIPDEHEGLTGAARTEHDFEATYGVEYFDRDATAATAAEGTKENPIPIYSAEPERIVGISLEVFFETCFVGLV